MSLDTLVLPCIEGWGEFICPLPPDAEIEDPCDGECLGLGKRGWTWPLLSMLSPRWAQQKKTQCGSCPFTAFWSCPGRLPAAAEDLGGLRVPAALAQVWAMICSC